MIEVLEGSKAFGTEDAFVEGVISISYDFRYPTFGDGCQDSTPDLAYATGSFYEFIRARPP